MSMSDEAYMVHLLITKNVNVLVKANVNCGSRQNSFAGLKYLN